MTGHRKWSEVRDSRSRQGSEVAKGSSRAALQAKLSDHVRSLADLRRARQLTQQQLAKVMQVSQAQVSRVENQADLYLSTLRSYIEAMGGEMQIRVAFPGTNWTEVTIGDVTEADVQGSEVQASAGVVFDTSVLVQMMGHDCPEPSNMLRIWSIPERNTSTHLDLSTALSGLWTCNAHLHASSSAQGFIVRDPEKEQAARESRFSWRTAANPLVPADSEEFISSAQFKEK